MANIRCGNCRKYHASVEEVRQCHLKPQQTLPGIGQEPTNDAGATLDRLSGTATTRMATERQREYVKDLADRAGVKVNLEVLTASEASKLIDELKEAQPLVWEVPNGLYAINSVDADGHKWSFFKVKKLSSGAVLVWQFASDVEYPVMNPGRKRAVLDHIGRDIKAAAIAYGQQIGRCSACGRKLTDNESIAAGIGPVCAEKRGWAR